MKILIANNYLIFINIPIFTTLFLIKFRLDITENKYDYFLVYKS